MVEFGAGGQITQAEEPVHVEEPTETTQNDEGENTATANAETPAPAITPAPPSPTRRKRKAKGWFCPVCRQPYTSLLRITTTPPEINKAEAEPVDVRAKEETPVPSPGILSGGFRPTFLRGFSRNPQPDVEAQRA